MIASIIKIIGVVTSLISKLYDTIKVKNRIKEVKDQQIRNAEEDRVIDEKIKERKIDALNKELGYLAKSAPTKKTVSKKTTTKKAPTKKNTTKKVTKK